MRLAGWRKRSVDEFKPDWLALREPADVLARSSRLTRVIADRFPDDVELHALDIATGTGANVRYLAEHLPPRQRWMVVDRDPVLLDELPMRMRSWGVARGLEVVGEGEALLLTGARLMCRLARCRRDLATDIEGGDGDVFAGSRFVTASALLDLVSGPWLRALAGRCRENRAAVLFALTYDGRIRCSPEEPEDDTMRALVNTHQRTDKGFGAALGATACGWAEQCFASLGYHVQREPSDWVLEPDARQLQEQLIDGWAEAAIAVGSGQPSSIRSWRTRRLAHVTAGRSRLVVGHEDLAAWLPG
jgi:hypothetical protein